jgi:CheY-like chemotaxis protein
MRILLVEDIQEQIKVATKLLQDKNHQFLVAINLAEALFAIKNANFDGVLTDLHFPEKENAEQAPPCGLAVLAKCSEKGVPVVVVSDINHHFATYAKTVVEAIEKLHPVGKIPFVMDSKDWTQGLQLLGEIM